MVSAADIAHPKLRKLYEYWDNKRGERIMPARANIDPLDMTYIVGNVILVDVIAGETPRFRIRFLRSSFSDLRPVSTDRRVAAGIPVALANRSIPIEPRSSSRV